MAQSEKIIISVELKDKGVKTGLQQTTSQVKETTDATQRLVAAEKDEAYWASEAGRAEAERSVKTNIAKGEAKALALETMKLTKATKQGKTQTGLNNAILTEAGRAASDAQYGMQGMSNNLGQLATLMAQHADTQGGFVASFKELGKSLMGAGGVLIAIQLFISFLPMIEKWYKKVTSAGDDFVESLTSQQALLSTVSKKLLDDNTTLEERKSILESLKKDNKELYNLLVEDGKERGNTNETIKKYLELLKKEELIRKNVEKINEEIKNTSEDLQDNQENLDRIQGIINKTLEKEKKIREDTYFSESSRQSAINKQQARRLYYERLLAEEIIETAEEDKELQEKKVELTEKVLVLQQKSAKLRKELGIGKEAEEEIKQDRKRVEAIETNFSWRAKLANNWFANQVKNQMKLATTAKKMDEVELVDYRSKLEKKADLFLEHAEKLKDAQIQAEQIGGLAQGFIDSEIQAEEAKTAKLNNQLKERLANENLSADERKKIQAKIAANDMILAKKKNKLAEKQFKIDKALSISTTLINTFESAVKAYKSQLTADPTSPFRAILAGAKASAFGLAKVAMIAKQKFVPSAISAPSVGGDTGGGGGIGGAAPQAPAFNIVGSSGVNQLSDAIAGQENRPVRTYVVASDVSTAQELDRNIIESASL